MIQAAFICGLVEQPNTHEDRAMKSIQLIDAVKDRHGIASDNQLANFLGIPRGHVALIRTGRRKLSADQILLVADALDECPEYIAACIQAERATKDRHRALWMRAAATLKKHGTAAPLMALLATSAWIAASNSPGQAFEAAALLPGLNIYYANLTIIIASCGFALIGRYLSAKIMRIDYATN